MIRKGDWYVYCDICGRRCYHSETVKLSNYTGKGGLIVCKQDADSIDPGLIPYNVRAEKNVPEVRINHTSTDSDTLIYNSETEIIENAGEYIFLATNLNQILLTEDGTYLRI